MKYNTKQDKKILVITKRQYTNKDLIDDRYGRMRELPLQLANIGFDVTGYCFSYNTRKNKAVYDKDDEVGKEGVRWKSFDLGYLILPGIIQYIFNIVKEIRSNSIDVIWASSDAPHVILGCFIGKAFKIPCVVDLYDNYEAFPLTNFIFIKQLYRYSLKRVDMISRVSDQLLDWINKKYHPNGELFVVENGIPLNKFIPMSATECRETFGLPKKGKVIALTGAIDKNRGVDILFSAFVSIQKRYPDTYLVLAGKSTEHFDIFDHPNVFFLGLADYNLVPEIINSADLNVVINKDNMFGNFCFPQKFYEIIACNRPLLAPDIGVTKKLLLTQPDLLYEPGNELDLIEKIENQLKYARLANIEPVTWREQAEKLKERFNSILKGDVNI